MEKSKFIKLIKDHAIETMKKHNIVASLQMAQVILESGWGESELFQKANNVAGVKGSYKGESIELPTTEYVNGKKLSVIAEFRKYPSLQEAFDDKVELLLNAKKDKNTYRYRNLIGVSDYKKACELIQKDGYATDPKYADKLIDIIESNKLYEYDKVTEITESDKTTVEVEKVADEDLYRVRKSATAADSQLGAFRDLQSAIDLCNKHIGYKVFNLRGTIIHESTAKDPNSKDLAIGKKVIVKGGLIKLNNAPLYISSIANTKAKNITGTFYIYDGKEYAGNRYRICKDKSSVGKGTSYIMGYIDLDDMI